MLFTFALLAASIALPGISRAQENGDLDSPKGSRMPALLPPASKPYREPTQKKRFQVYTAQMFAPYSLGSVMFVSGIHQAEHFPAEWQEGMTGFGERVASNLGTGMTNATARYLLSEAFREDAQYYPCECRGFWPRFGNAVFSAVTARRGKNGHQVFGVPNLLAPYAGPFASVYGWYPSRYGWKDALRMGNHGLVDEIGTNISLEFLPSILPRRARRWRKWLHLDNPVGASSAAE